MNKKLVEPFTIDINNYLILRLKYDSIAETGVQLKFS